VWVVLPLVPQGVGSSPVVHMVGISPVVHMVGYPPYILPKVGIPPYILPKVGIPPCEVYSQRWVFPVRFIPEVGNPGKTVGKPATESSAAQGWYSHIRE